ncbi:MAG: 3-deoxy-D-manno-octulosonic acid transferase [Nitrospinae bacterium]|nr:3-deoxy-D-manno-octulosonic acid transferase [Nitrospinota bacterium]
MGYYSDEIKNGLINQSPIWIHAVSVGEVIASTSLIKSLRKEYPDIKIILSTVTDTGQQIAKERIKEADYIIYFPFDFSWSVMRALNTINPIICIIMETELWPNFLKEANKKAIPVAVINGRISERSFKRYRMISLFMKSVLESVRLFSMQTEDDAKRIVALGADKRNVNVSGNIKYDNEFKDIEEEKGKEIKNTLEVNNSDRIFIAGSTHPGEEEMVVKLYSNILKNYPDFRLVIAPRHIDRVGEVEEIVKKMGLDTVRKTELLKGSRVKDQGSSNTKPIIILDTIGELSFMYSIADIVFIGGSLIPHGGQNILEPAFYKKPVIFGKYMMNFQEIAKEMILSGGGIQVNNEEDLIREVGGLLNNKKKMIEIGEKGYQVIMKNRGALQKNLELIGGIISHRFTQTNADKKILKRF